MLQTAHEAVARIMVLATFATGYNIAFGTTGLLSLGHALFFGAGIYACGLLVAQAGIAAAPALVAGLLAGGAMAAAVGVLALRTGGVSFMIVTLMFAQAGYLSTLYFGTWTRGDEGFVLPRAARAIGAIDLSADTPRYLAALVLFSAGLLIHLALTRSALGRAMVAMRENEERSRMLGYDPFRVKLAALALSGAYAGAAGAAYAVLFGYVGATFASIQYSILPLLYVLLGGAGTVLGPFLGALVMFYLIDLSSSVTTAHLAVVGGALLLLVLFAPRGILGWVRERWAPWLP
ncbi:MAG TPA: branched-chain amino acid ABC transporter permease [Paracoccaceae bacterium]|nr:branched-chain amino acid ABC transporter permease [Paracoccaceae bacterium]